MSEFSESFHLLSTDQQDGIALLKRSSLHGFVFPAANNWVTVLPEQFSFEADDPLIQANSGILLHYVHAEDHGWSIRIYNKNTLAFHFEVQYEEDMEGEQDLDLTELLSVINLDTDSYESLDGQLLEDPAPEEIAELVGLVNYDWISYSYVQNEKEQFPDQFKLKGIQEI